MAKEVRLIVRGDDFGMCHSVNQAIVKCFKEGILTSASLMVPPPWFIEAAEICKENPEFQIGIHLDLTSEWYPYRWRPVLPTSEVPTLVDENGYFRRSTKDFLAGQPDLIQVEKELRAQVQVALDRGIDVAYLDAHMYTARATPELWNVVKRIAKDYRLPLSDGLTFGETRTSNIYKINPPEKLKTLLTILENLKPGLWLFLCHPGLNTLEMKAINSRSPRPTMDVAAHRSQVTKIITGHEVKEMVEKKGIELVGYRALRDQWRQEGKL